MSVSNWDYDLHGVVGVRLVNASPRDRAAVDRQLGPIAAPLAREPDLVIRFVDRLPVRGRLVYVGRDDAAFSDDAFLLLRSKHKTTARVQIPLERIGGPLEVVCETGLAAVPLLIPIINLTALSKGVLPLHASAFIYNGHGVVATGWSKGGKTEMLLAFMAEGATYLGDEWVYLTPGGEQVFGVPEPLTVWDWHLRDMPQFAAALSWKQRARLRGVGLLAGAAQRAIPAGPRRSAGWARLLSRAAPVLQRQCHVRLPPEQVFGPKYRAVGAGRVDKLLFVASHDRAEVEVEPMSSERIAQRMAFSLQEERLPFLSCYHKFRFAFPARANSFLERAEDVQRALLHSALQGKEAYGVYHPYPLPLRALFDAVAPLLEASGGGDSRGDASPPHLRRREPGAAPGPISFPVVGVPGAADGPH